MTPAPKTKKILLGISLVLAIFFLIQSANAIHVHPNMHFSPSGLKTTYTTNTTFDFSHIVVEGNALYLNDSIIKHIPCGGGRIEVFLDAYNPPTYIKYMVNTSGTVTAVNATIGGFTSGNNYTVKVDGTNWNTVTASAEGQINFNYTSWSNHTFEIISVAYGNGTPPVVDFSWSPLYPVVGQLVKFTDLSHDYGNIVSWNWDFGNGKYSSSRNPTTRYNKAGSYVVKLKVTDNDDAYSAISNMVTVYDKEQPEVNYTLIVYVSDTHDASIANAKVSISNGAGLYYGYTNENGSIKFYNISEYTVITAEKKGYNTYSTELYIDKDTSAVITLERKAAPQLWVIVPIMLVAVIGGYIYKKKS